MATYKPKEYDPYENYNLCHFKELLRKTPKAFLFLKSDGRERWIPRKMTLDLSLRNKSVYINKNIDWEL